MRLFVAALLVAASIGVAAAEPIAVDGRSVPLDDGDPARNAVGALRYRGGLDLSSADSRFGGLSGLAVSADGGRMIAVSDRGMRFDARLAYDGRGNLAGVREARLAILFGVEGRPLVKKKKSDAESLAPVDGGLLVAFERRHRILRYAGTAPIPVALARPKGVKKAPKNGGIEALTALADGRLLALTEKLAMAGGRLGWVGDGKAWAPLVYVPKERFDPSGAALLPGGDVVVLERAYSPLSGPGARLVRLAHADVVPDGLLVGREIALLWAPLSVDNFEGVAARRGGSGETLIYLLSDDNFNPLQRTLLLMFELVR